MSLFGNTPADPRERAKTPQATDPFTPQPYQGDMFPIPPAPPPAVPSPAELFRRAGVPGVGGSKPTNPKDAVGIKKVPFHVVPMRVIAGLGLALLEGARKYGSFNWRVAGVRASVYFDAMHRHMGAWWEGQDIDPDSGLSHVDKAIASLVVLRDSMLQGNWVDDRPVRGSDLKWVDSANGKAAEIIERYPDAKAPFTQKSVDARTTTCV